VVSPCAPSFEHASHVALSASKLLKRIVLPEEIDYRRSSKESTVEKLLAVTKQLHNHTLGISSDPVAQFAIVFASLIHDVKHPGVPNAQFAAEEPDLAIKYRHTSIAEQRSSK
jgi:3'5'-cyclic nucleotide phosphodiesterase